MQHTWRVLLLLVGMISATFVLLSPAPVYADGPVCRLPDIDIPDGSGTYDRLTQTPNPNPGAVVTDSLTLATPTLISDLNLVISLTHSYVGDLVVTLTHTSGASQTAATVINMPLLGQSAHPATEPACSGDNIRLILDDEGLYHIQTDCAEEPHPATRNAAFIEGEHYTPASPLSVFDGEIISGTWEIAITDNFAGDWGTLNGWCLAPNSATQDLHIVKAVTGSMYPGDPLTYTIRFNNFGTLPETGIVLTDIIPAELTGINISHSGATITDTGATPGYVWNVEPLSEGENGVITITGLLSSTLSGGMTISNVASIRGDNDTTPANNQSQATITTPTPDLHITKVDNGGLDPTSGRITYTLSYSNTGGRATGVQLTEILPAGTSFNAAGSPGWQQVGATNEYTYSIGTMLPGDSGNVTFVVDVNDPLPAGTGNIVNTAYIGDDGQNGSDQNQADNSTQTISAAPKPDLTLTKRGSPSLVLPGQPVTYTISLTNNGQATAIGVVVTDIIPADIGGRSVVSTGVAITDTGALPAYVWQVANLSPGQSGVITITGTLTGSPAATLITNTATITTGSIELDSQNNTGTASLTVGWPDLVISQTDSVDAAPLGQPLTYTLTLTNQGTYTATGLVVTSTLSSGFNFNSSVPGTPTCTESGGIVVCALPNALGPGQQANLSLNVTPTLTGTLANTATVTASELESNTANNEAVETTTVAEPAVLITQSGGSTNLLEGTLTDTYTIALTTQPAHNVTVTLTDDNQVDVLPTSLTFTPANWSISQTVTVTATDDGLYEGIHTGIISHTVSSSDSNYNGLAAANVIAQILDDELPPTVQFTTATSSGGESAGPAHLYLSLTPPTTQAVTVDYTIGGTATGGTDHTLSNGTATIDAGQVSATLTLTVTNDFFHEPDETVIVTLENPVNAGPGTPISHTYTILDDDTAGITLTQSGGSTAVTEGGATDSYQLVLTSQPTALVTITVTGNAQVSGLPTELVFTGLSWNQPQTVTVRAIDDAVFEGTHTGLLTHTVTSVDSDYSRVTVPEVTATITDNDSPPDTTPPTAPGLITPTNSITLTTARPVFRWNAATDSGGSGVVSYTLTLTHSGIVTMYGTAQTALTPTTNLPNGSYLWTVRAHDAAGNTGPAALPANFAIDTTVNETPPYKLFLPLVIK